MSDVRISSIADRIARSSSGKLRLGPQRKKRGRSAISWYQVFKYNQEGWELDDLIRKIIRYMKSPPTEYLDGYEKPEWFVNLDTKHGNWTLRNFDKKNIKTYQKMVEQGDLTGTGIAGWSFASER